MADEVKFEIVEAHWDEAKDMAKQAIRRGLEAVGNAAVADVVKEIGRPKKHGDGSVRPNVVTGRLWNSITFALDADDGDGISAVVVGTNVEYAPYVEYGTSRSKAYPFLKKTIQKNLDRYHEIFKHNGSVD